MRSNHPVFSHRRSAQWLGALAVALLVGCGSEMATQTVAPEGEAADLAVEQSLALAPSSKAELDTPTDGSTSGLNPSQSRPQLIKNAALRIELADVDGAIATINKILRQAQGDLLELADQETPTHAPRQVWVEFRVPQAALDDVLEQLRALGTVQEQTITAEDVSNQLVDLQARLRNLRKSEEALLKIMERSGSIADVLEVTREMSTVREAVERTDAQLKNLQNQVAYSSVSLTLVSTQAPSPEASPIQQTLSETWQTASTAMRGLSVGLLQLILWLLVFSPYIGVLVLAGWLGRRYWQRPRATEAE